MKKIFGGINLTWPKLIIMAIILGVYTAIMTMLPIAKDTSFSDLTVSFEVWIFFGIFIIMNSKSPKDSALKCFIFFLISQPLVYLVQDIIKHSNLFNTYYRFWILWTIACIPMGFIGYYMKKDKWWGLLILIPMLLLTAEMCAGYLSDTMFSFPRHLLTTIFCIGALIIYPLAIFNNKKIKIAGLVISGLLIIFIFVICIINPPKYSTIILYNGDEYQFDDSYNVYLVDKKYGDLSVEYDAGLEDWALHADFKKAGKTEFVIESPDGKKTTFDISIKRSTYTIKEKNN
ncbi:hypothetical protein [Lachnospira multipara]|uniref:hypothetical protein n=1 Tax=Lachnospira multipara TaxID=28051 RepID=UPI00048079F4|nr:hypothetical protein [Lachnospira multipara]